MAVSSRDLARDMEKEMTEEKSKLTKAQEVFIDEYLKCFNGTEAYSRAYPKASRVSAWSAASRLLGIVRDSYYFKERLNQIHMSADEALKLTADIARGDVTEFITPFGNIDIDKLRQGGKGRLIKKIKQKTVTKIGKGESDEDTEVLETEIELYPADAALDKILRVHGKYKDVGTNENPLNVNIKGYIGWTPENWKQDEEK